VWSNGAVVLLLASLRFGKYDSYVRCCHIHSMFVVVRRMK
jgi:hypothetical protein